jgi:hypothetical protein
MRVNLGSATVAAFPIQRRRLELGSARWTGVRSASESCPAPAMSSLGANLIHGKRGGGALINSAVSGINHHSSTAGMSSKAGIFKSHPWYSDVIMRLSLLSSITNGIPTNAMPQVLAHWIPRYVCRPNYAT